jgi:hypothetical protein
MRWPRCASCWTRQRPPSRKHGTQVIEELLLGSVTRHVLAESRSDVLVVTGPRVGDL